MALYMTKGCYITIRVVPSTIVLTTLSAFPSHFMKIETLYPKNKDMKIVPTAPPQQATTSKPSNVSIGLNGLSFRIAPSKEKKKTSTWEGRREGHLLNTPLMKWVRRSCPSFWINEKFINSRGNYMVPMLLFVQHTDLVYFST